MVSLYHHLGFQFPWSPAAKGKSPNTTTPFIVYGGSTAVGSYAIKFARLSNIHPIIAIAGKGAHYIRKFLDESKGDVVVDYREGPEKTITGIRNALRSSTGSNDLPANHALDTIVTEDSTTVLRSVMNPGGNINYVLMSPPMFLPRLHRTLGSARRTRSVVLMIVAICVSCSVGGSPGHCSLASLRAIRLKSEKMACWGLRGR